MYVKGKSEEDDGSFPGRITGKLILLMRMQPAIPMRKVQSLSLRLKKLKSSL